MLFRKVVYASREPAVFLEFDIVAGGCMKKRRILTFLLVAAVCSASADGIKTGDRYRARYMFRHAEQEYKRAIRSNPGRPAGYSRLARIFLSDGRHGEARLLLYKALSLKKQDPEVWALLAALHLHQDNLEQASYHAQRGLSLFPDHPALLLQREGIALALFSRTCQGLLEKHPNAAPVRKMLGFRYLAAGLTYLALAQFDKLEQEGGKELYRMLAVRFQHGDNPVKVREYCNKILAIDKTDIFALNTLGKMALDDGYLQAGYRYYFDAAKYHPDNGEAFETVGHLTLQMGQKDKALEYLLRAYTLGRRNKNLLTTIGYLYSSSSDEQERKKAQPFLDAAGKPQPDTTTAQSRAVVRNNIARLRQFETFFKGDPRKEADTQYRIAGLHAEIGEYDPAYRSINAACRHFPLDPAFNLLRADLERKLGKYRNLDQTLTLLSRLIPDSPALLRLLLAVYAEEPMKDADKYLATLRRALDKHPGDRFFLVQLARYHEGRREFRQAITLYSRAGKKDPSLKTKIAALRSILTREGLTARLKRTGSVPGLLTLAETIVQQTRPGDPLQLQALRKALSRQPASPGINILTGEAYAAAFFRELRYPLLAAAVKHLDTALRLQPGHPQALQILSRLLTFDHEGFLRTPELLDRIRRDNALQDSFRTEDGRILARSYPDLLASRFFNIGKIMYRKDNSPHAIPYLARTLDIDDKDRVDRLLALGTVLRAFGRHPQAIDAYRRLLQEKNLPDYRHYTVIHATLGNLYSAIATQYPYSVDFLLAEYPDALTNPHETADKIAAHLKKMKEAAQGEYRLYIQQNTLFIQRNMGEKKIQELSSVETDVQEAYLRIAQSLIEDGKNDTGLTLLEKASARLAPGQRIRILMALANGYAAQQDRDKTTRLYELLRKENPSDWRHIHAHARWNLSLGNIQESLNQFTAAAALRRNDLNLRIIISFLHWRMGNTEQAVKDLKAVLATDEDNINANYYLCKILSQQGEYLQAEEHGNRIHELFKKNLVQTLPDQNRKDMLLDTLHTLAESALQRGDTFRALKYAYLGINFDAGDQFHFLSLTGDVFFLQKKYARAERYYSLAVKKNPGIPFLRFKLARTFLQTEKLYQARQILEDILARVPKFHHRHSLMILLARMRERDNEPRAAEALLMQALREFPHLQEGYLSLAVLLKKQNRYAEQGRILEQGLAAIGKAPLIRDALAWYLLDRRQPLERALQLAGQNIEDEPDNADFRATLGYLLFRNRQYRQSRTMIPASLMVRSRRERVIHRPLSLENAQEHFRVGNYPQAYQLVCYPRPADGRSIFLGQDTLFTRLLRDSTPLN